MKKTLLLIGLIIPFMLFGQELVDPDKVWHTQLDTSSSWTTPPEWKYASFKFGKEEIIDSLIYRPLLQTNTFPDTIWQQTGKFFREDRGDIYLYQHNRKEEQRYAQRNLKVGDTITVDLCSKILRRKDTVQVEQRTYEMRIFEADWGYSEEIWGIGTRKYLFDWMITCRSDGNGYVTTCVYDKDSLVYTDNFYKECYPLTNPTRDRKESESHLRQNVLLRGQEIRIDGSKEIDEVRVVSISGKKIIESKSKRIPTIDLCPGTYFVFVYENGSAYKNLIVIQ